MRSWHPLLLLAVALCVPRLSAAVKITDAVYEGRPQFKIVTPDATWFYDKAGGGFSRLIDRDGRDWIGFHRDPLDQSPASAAAGYRGMPNAIVGKGNTDAGAGHPGFNLCESTRAAGDLIRTVSKSGRWAWTWRFTDTEAVFTMEKADPAYPWWFLYEASIAGRFAPHQQYWGTDLGGPRHETPDHKGNQEDIGGHWRWAYFGDASSDRVLFIANLQRTAFPSMFSYFGDTTADLASPDGMVVFGFGRTTGSLGPHISGPGAQFAVGFSEGRISDEKAHERLAGKIDRLIAH